jgi:hypothetical protein
LRINKQWDPLQLHGENTTETDCLTYLRSVIRKDGGADGDIKNCISRANHAFNNLHPFGNSVHYLFKTRSGSSTPIWRQSSFMDLWHEEWPKPAQTDSRHSETGVYATSRASDRVIVWERNNQNPIGQEIQKRK